MNDKIEIHTSAKAPASRVFEALTDSKELEQWFAERASVSLGDDRYDFWGRYTVGAPSQSDGRHRLIEVEKDKKLTFEWTMRGEDTHVEIRLTPTPNGTHIELEQPIPARQKTDCSVGDFWLLSLENLRRWVEDGAPPVQCDYSTPARGGVELDVDIDASREDVFRALTEPGHINRWIAKDAKLEPRVGGSFTYGWGDEGPVKIVEFQPTTKLAHTWEHAGEPETLVTWTLDGSGGRTRLHLVHSGFGADRNTEDFRTGWLKHIVWMKSTIEKGDAWAAPQVVSADWVEA